MLGSSKSFVSHASCLSSTQVCWYTQWNMFSAFLSKVINVTSYCKLTSWNCTHGVKFVTSPSKYLHAVVIVTSEVLQGFRPMNGAYDLGLFRGHLCAISNFTRDLSVFGWPIMLLCVKSKKLMLRRIPEGLQCTRILCLLSVSHVILVFWFYVCFNGLFYSKMRNCYLCDNFNACKPEKIISLDCLTDFILSIV